MADLAWDTVFKGVIALVVSPFVVLSIVRISREWGERGTKIGACVEGVDKLVGKMGEFTTLVEKDHAAIKSELAKQSYILTGAEGLNGLRGDVKELHDAFREKNDADHLRWGEFGLWQLQSDVRLGLIEGHLDLKPATILDNRLGKPDRRNITRLVKNDRRGLKPGKKPR